tara:strand:+ start:385 stop:1860 length:1476 start_codon:yes stop_codon:yes gene_type:complete
VTERKIDKNNERSKVKIFPVPFKSGSIKDNIIIMTNIPSKPSQEQIIYQALKFNAEGKISEAIKYYQYFIDQGFKDYRVFSNYGGILQDLGKLKEAELILRKAIEIKPNGYNAHYNLGATLYDLGELKQAEKSYIKAIEIKPDYAEAHLNLGNVFFNLGKLKEAEKSTRKAVELNPDSADIHHNLGTILLKSNKFKEGWLEYEWRWKAIKNIKKIETSKPEWNSNKRGRVLLQGEQGIGDILLFSSLIPDFIPKVDQLIISIDKRLIPLFERSLNGNISFISQNDFIEEERYDFYIAMGSLPKYLRTSLKSFHTSKKLKLKVNAERSKILRDELISTNFEKIVGISWKTSSKVRTLSITLEKLILGIYSPKIRFVCLQYGAVQEELDQLRKNYSIDVYKSEEVDLFNDIDGLAALIYACDEVVSIDNLTPILAGALEKKSDVLLPINSSWPHGEDHCKSYWYESMRLFRQNTDSDLDIVLKQIKEEIEIKD